MSDAELRPNYAYWQTAGEYWVEEYDRRRQQIPYYLLQELAWLAIFVPEVPASVLELGCGVGRHLKYLREVPGLDVHGCDQSPTMLAGCRTWAEPDWADRHLTLVDPIGPLPYEDQAFDFVFSCEALIHTHPSDLSGRIREMTRIARKAVIHMEPAPGYEIHQDAHDGSWNHDFEAEYRDLSLATNLMGTIGAIQHIIVHRKTTSWAWQPLALWFDRISLLAKTMLNTDAQFSAPNTNTTRKANMRTFNLNTIHIGEQKATMESIVDPWGEDDQIVNAAIEGKFDEHLSLSLWCEWARNSTAGEIFLDIGAYSGIFALGAATYSSTLRILAFEPSTITFGRLAKNVLLNNFDTKIIPVNLAAGEKVSQAEFPHRYGTYSLCSGESGHTEKPDHTQPVLTAPLDELLEDQSTLPYLNSSSVSIFPFSRVAAIKIDVQGDELDVLRGATGLIARDKPLIIAEASSGEFEAELAELAESFSYGCASIPGERNVVLFHKDHPKPDFKVEAAQCKQFVSAERKIAYVNQ